MLITLLVVCTLFVAYANGANDNFKGIATLYGSGTTRFRGALWLGTLATLAGSIASVYLAAGLVRAFSGRGLVPDELTTATPFLTAVAFGAAGTVMLATCRGLPISTTHALTGALVGAGLAGAGSSLNLNALGTTFVLPLLLSPLLTVALTMLAYRCAQTIANRLQVSRNTATASVTPRHRYQGGYFGAATQSVVDSLHYVSAFLVSFARGLNDTPKIVALLLVVKALALPVSMLGIALAMAVGGLVNGRRVAETVSLKISRMDDGQALTANIVTALLVISASRFGLPVSTTHVSVGAISGIGIANGTAQRPMIATILLSWVVTLPTAAIAAAVAYAVLS